MLGKNDSHEGLRFNPQAEANIFIPIRREALYSTLVTQHVVPKASDEILFRSFSFGDGLLVRRAASREL